MPKTLSILIVSLKKRKHLLDQLLRVLQIQLTDEVEVLISSDDGEIPIGTKRNNLLNKASGKYVCFIDDDDLVSPFYTKYILEALKTSPDCVGLQGIISLKTQGPKIFIHSLSYASWFEKDGVYYRCPNHLNPVKTEIAKNVKFPDISSGEDRVYSYNLKDKLKTEVYINKPIYYYYPSSEV
jgi:glycosyltransferase involved in cell wall biosynthesis